MTGPFTHCHWCGTPYAPATTTWPRTCPGCGEISYRNPLPVAVALQPVEQPDGTRALLVIRRTIEPGYGELALPGGYIDYGENWQTGAVRELREEAGLEVDPAHVRLADTGSDERGAFLMLFALFPPRPLDTLPPSVPTDETDGWHLLTTPTRLAFPLHTQVAEAWFKGAYD
ncbi:NUDIX domain-containing protein [Kitasatospora sp. NPDC051853]|uniref:NUDIX domain-containing protein n=1 Tax=Kitasatospora sp. NPDC051853 TaxID=3364058 RepID=UPI0037B30372